MCRHYYVVGLLEEDVLLDDTHVGRHGLPQFPPALFKLSQLPNSLGHLPTEKKTKRIERIPLAAQSTARCAKHPDIDRSSARASARSVSAASANKSDARLENAESRQSYRTIGSDVDGRNTMDDANDEDADNSTII